MKLLGAPHRRLLALAMLAGLATACDSGAAQPAVAKQAPTASADKGAPAPADPEAAPVAADADQADAEQAAADDKAGCIYVDGEKGHEELECPHPPKPGTEAAEPDAPPNGEGHYGEKFALQEAVPLSTALASAGEAPVLVSGEVEAVCQKKGCWMVVKDGTQSARVLMKDHAFAVPMDCRGKKVQIEGTLASRTFTEAQVKHLAKDGGKDPETVSGEQTEHVLTATGINIQS